MNHKKKAPFDLSTNTGIVLVVEDNDMNLNYSNACCRNFNYKSLKLIEATNGQCPARSS